MLHMTPQHTIDNHMGSIEPPCDIREHPVMCIRPLCHVQDYHLEIIKAPTHLITSCIIHHCHTRDNHTGSVGLLAIFMMVQYIILTKRIGLLTPRRNIIIVG
ncbi:hypothetical protein GDO78_013268 [Eleutherodactylus coqui]|uniref:Uncharacterized protein n=1 Tax=Eleutherodactylus coqui TaxID=57060 RepID=A0A8J6F078_ELECQ|nr:hypothetical protein GDO78_013268 [Eleutherodactylus coqui]